MHFADAIEAIRAIRDPKIDRYPVAFVTPIVSAMIAVLCTRNAELARERLSFTPQAEGYARNNGLLSAIDGTYQFPARIKSQVLTYTKLTSLAVHAEVDRCNEVINDLVFTQLAGFGQIANELAVVVGELHDNVASHANGLGFSCAQVYSDGVRRRIELAIADGGRGMLSNVRRKTPCTSDADAILWCLERGHTSTTPIDSWAQRLPEDVVYSPYPVDTATSQSAPNHHVGEGLWKLATLVKNLDGRLWIASGDGSILLQNSELRVESGRFYWEGVAIELEISVAAGGLPSARQQLGIERLAERLGL